MRTYCIYILYMHHNYNIVPNKMHIYVLFTSMVWVKIQHNSLAEKCKIELIAHQVDSSAYT